MNKDALNMAKLAQNHRDFCTGAGLTQKQSVAIWRKASEASACSAEPLEKALRRILTPLLAKQSTRKNVTEPIFARLSKVEKLGFYAIMDFKRAVDWWKIIQDPDSRLVLPYLRYNHQSLLPDGCDDHKAWDGLVLTIDDPFWNTHFPPNGWDCQCSISSISKRQLAKLGKSGPDAAPIGAALEGVAPEWQYNFGKVRL